MGTGSHRPQFEAARGRPDEMGGIQHVRALKSHTKLKYREKIVIPEKTRETKAIEGPFLADQLRTEGTPVSSLDSSAPFDSGEQTTTKNTETLNSSGDFLGESDNDSAESEDELLTMQRELQRLNQREQLRAQKENKTRNTKETASSKWRSEPVFKKTKKRPKKDSFIDKFMR